MIVIMIMIMIVIVTMVMVAVSIVHMAVLELLFGCVTDPAHGDVE